MMRRSSMFLLALCSALVAVAAGTAVPQAPEKVKNALGVLAYIQADMASKLPAKAYNRLPHEVQEFREAVPAMTDAVAGESPALRSQVEDLTNKALAAAINVESVSSSGDEAKISAAVVAVDRALQPLNQLFPAELRPVPGQLPRPPGLRRPDTPQGGPPPELR